MPWFRCMATNTRRRRGVIYLAVLVAAFWACLGARGRAELSPAEFVEPPRLIAKNTKERCYCGATVVRCASGKLVIPLWDFESSDGGRSWTSSKPPVGNSGNLIRLRDGRWASVGRRECRLGQGGAIPTIQFCSDIEAADWSAPVDVTAQDDIYYVPNERFLETPRGVLVIAAARGGGRYEGDTNTAGCFASTDQGKTWMRTEGWAALDGERGMQEPNIAELDDGRFIMLARTGKGAHHRSYSSDLGRTWSTPEPTTLTAACSPLTMKRMPDGRLFVAYEHAEPSRPESFFPRNPLAWSLSSDDGATWSPPRQIDATPGESMLYPSVSFLDHGILIVYSTEYADPTGGFTDESWKAGGAKSCILRYPPR